MCKENTAFLRRIYFGKSDLLSVIILLACCMQVFFAHAQKRENTRSLATELTTLYDLSQLPQYRSGSKIYQVSSYDTTGGNNDGFSGKYSYLRKTKEGDLVIFDAKGSGVINRIWTPTPTEDTLDFYIDDMSKPAFSIKFSDLFSGKRFPFIAPLCDNEVGGYYCYLPIPFQKHCKIIFRGERLMFYQIQWRTYPKTTAVKKFNLPLNADEENALDKVVQLWQKNKWNVTDFANTNESEILSETKSLEIKPGESKNIFDLKKGGRIVGMEISPAESFSGKFKQLDIQINWDNEQNPAVDCPVADFFGYAFDEPSVQSILLGSKNNKNYCYIPMPFDKKASIVLNYRKRNDDKEKETLRITTKIYYTKKKRNPQTEGKFYTRWISQKESAEDGPHVFLDVKGKGHYIGTILQSQGLNPGMTLFFEGDDSTSVDGEFRMHGTGSEDYFNGGWYALLDRWDTKLSLPIHGSLTYSLPLARTGGYRFFLSDKLPYEKHFYQSIEHGPTDNVPVKYTSLAFYYSDHAVERYIKPQNNLTEVYTPDTLIIYPQLMKFSVGGHVDMKFEGPLVLTGDNNSLARIDISRIPVGNYKLYLDYNEDKNGGSFSLWQRQVQLTDKITTYNTERKHIPDRYLCDITIDDFRKTLTFKFIDNGDKKSLYLNRLIFIRIPEQRSNN